MKQIPSHTHIPNSFGNWSSTTTNRTRLSCGIYVGTAQNNPIYQDSSSYNTGATGGGEGHTHTLNSHTHTMSATGSSSTMPPYLTVYMWKRTA